MTLVRNERAKLTAAWLNAIAAGMIVTGVVAPIAAALYGVPGPSQKSPLLLAAISIVWLLIGIALHFLARSLLGGLRQ